MFSSSFDECRDDVIFITRRRKSINVEKKTHKNPIIIFFSNSSVTIVFTLIVTFRPLQIQNNDVYIYHERNLNLLWLFKVHM